MSRPLAQDATNAVAKVDDETPEELPEVVWMGENDSRLPHTWPAKPCKFQNNTAVQNGVPEGPQKLYPEFKYHMAYDTSKYRIWMFPEAYFTFLHERTGVLGPYILLWGGVITLISKEYLIYQEEFYACAAFLTIFPYLAYRFGPQADRWFRMKYNDELMIVDRLKESKIQQYTNEADALDEDSQRGEAGKEVFAAYSANAENMVEAEFRGRQEQVHEAFKRRLDYQVALQNLEEQMIQKQTVSWVKQEVDKAIKGRSQKEGIAQCLQDLKALAATNVTI